MIKVSVASDTFYIQDCHLLSYIFIWKRYKNCFNLALHSAFICVLWFYTPTGTYVLDFIQLIWSVTRELLFLPVIQSLSDGDGKIEIAVGFSDRLVRTYRWYPYSDGKGGEIAFLSKWALDAQVCYKLNLLPTSNPCFRSGCILLPHVKLCFKSKLSLIILSKFYPDISVFVFIVHNTTVYV